MQWFSGYSDCLRVSKVAWRVWVTNTAAQNLKNRRAKHIVPTGGAARGGLLEEQAPHALDSGGFWGRGGGPWVVSALGREQFSQSVDPHTRYFLFYKFSAEIRLFVKIVSA